MALTNLFERCGLDVEQNLGGFLTNLRRLSSVVKMEFQCCLAMWKDLPVLLQYEYWSIVKCVAGFGGSISFCVGVMELFWEINYT